MNYYALFLSNESYIEKCLILIKYIGNPKSKSLPHITLRLFKEQDAALNYIGNKKISFLNIIEPGVFNFDKAEGPYVVYLKCESEELEEIDYRPDYPYSRLHITLYEGTNFEYANRLYELLENAKWHFKLTFDFPKELSEQKIGFGTLNKSIYQSICKELLGEDCTDICRISEIDTDKKIKWVQIILTNLNKYLSEHTKDQSSINSIYSDRETVTDDSHFLDESAVSGSVQVEDQLIINGFPNIVVDKPVQDAIFITPPECSRDMAQLALQAFGDDSKEIDFGDSAIGTGALFIALKRLIDTSNSEHKTKYIFNSAIGVDINEDMAKESFFRCSKRNLIIIYGDAISPNINLKGQRNMMIVNPPYNRHEQIPEDYRKHAQELAKAQTGIKVMADSGLYVYHLLIMDKWLCEGGIGVWLLPSIFLQARYAKSVRQYLTSNVQLLRLHVYDETSLQFGDTMISTTIIVFRKLNECKDSRVIVTYGDSLSNPTFEKEINIECFRENIKNWHSIVFQMSDDLVGLAPKSTEIVFSSLFDIKRGLATGANSFFILKQSEAERHGIPKCALKPILPKSRYLNSLIINSKKDGYPDVTPQLVLIDCSLSEEEIQSKYPKFYSYLQTAKTSNGEGIPITDRCLIKGRHPWYKQENREPPLYLLTYMGRNKSNLPPLYFLLNKSKAVASNTYILLYPKPWLKKVLKEDSALYIALLTSLNESAKQIISGQTRVYSGGLHKLEPTELKELPVISLPNKILEAYKRQN